MNLKKTLSFILFAGTLAGSNWANADFDSAMEAQRSGNHEAAYAEFKKSAESGDDRAFGKLASMYLYGLGTDRDFSQAYIWFSIAQHTGDKYAEKFKDAASSNMSMKQVEEAEAQLVELRERFPKPTK